MIGSVAVAHAEPDGHTLILGTNQTHATNQSLLKNCPYDAVKDFAPSPASPTFRMCWWCGADSKAANVGALVRAREESPGALNYASTGVGSASHLAAELFKTKAGVDLQHIPFRGSAPMTTELLAGRVDLTFATLPSVIGHIDAGALRALAVASAKRARAAAEPADARRGRRAGVEADAWFALFAPAKTPAAAIERLYSAVSAGLTTEPRRRPSPQQGMTLALRSPAELAAWLPGEVAKWAAVIKAAGVVAE